MSDKPCRKATTYTGQHTRKQKMRTYMPVVVFEPRVPVFELAKTFHASDGAATVIGINVN
jgi:hypothetical protein